MWCEDCTLKEAFPGLYFLSRARDSSVAEVMCWIGGRIHWNFQFRRAPQDWEEDSFDQFMAIVYSLKVQGLALIRFVGSQQGVGILRLEVSSFLSTRLLFPSLGGWCANQRSLQGWLSFHGQPL